MAMAETLARTFVFRLPAAASGSSSSGTGGARGGSAQTLSLKRLACMQVSGRVVVVSRWQARQLVRAAAGEGPELGVGVAEEEATFLPSGEWPENFSMLNFEDLSAHYEPIIFKAEAQPSTFLADVMSKVIYTARAHDILEEVDHFFNEISGLPVIDADLRCIGVLSKKDRAKATLGLRSTVGEVMSSPAITLSADKTVSDAAVLMLKNKIHRIPVVNESQQVVGIVTRTDIFTALGGGK